ncbi:Mesaconyl-C4 CoA hydratase [Pleurostoma richardsiae]|uniref:Mesaconyl-C4 CoA hydratase n=1 Tax=Pleurostoma richardsiae TaxID=41990 RepID=A0AA38S1N5_9PEZI|nr:Mesaconyl-C4 CoA hydratase [Pleurostoma richardsiae]
MRARPTKAIYDVLSPTPSHLLNISLSDHLPPECYPPPFTRASLTLPPSSPSSAASPMPLAHHLVYFPPQIAPSLLLPDGTDPDHSPGPPFARRMWAGGAVSFAPGWRDSLRLDGRRAVCVESVGDVVVRGAPGDESVFVDVWRRYGPVRGEDDAAAAEEEVSRAPAVEERRTLVFMRDKTPARAAEDAGRESKVLKAPFAPDYSFTLTPTAALLFHFSALTFNAHAIHLDPLYARAVEGHRAPLVHGPLSLALMLAALRGRLARGEETTGGSGPAEDVVSRIEYRNLAPLYAGEEMRVCVRRKEGGRAAQGGSASPGTTGRWDVWIECPRGGMAVRGLAVTGGSA